VIATRPVGALRGWRAHAGLFVLFFLLTLALAWPSLRWPMVYDDLHLIRTFARAELLGTFHGGWDPDRVETEGFRPLTTLFNHLRAAALGENVLAHRLLVIGLVSLYLATLVPLASRFAETSAGAALLGGVFMLFSFNSTYHYVFLTDGVHALQGLAFVGAAHLLLKGLASSSRIPLVLSGAVVIVGCLVREDTLVIVPLLPLLGYFSGPATPDPGTRSKLVGYGLGLSAASLALLGYRALAVPSAPAPSLCLGGLLHRIVAAMNPVGTESFDGVSRIFSIGGWVILVALGLALARSMWQLRWRTPALWLVCAVIACCANTEFQRGNLFFFASSFLGLCYATALDEVWRRVPRGPIVAMTCAAWLVFGGAYNARALAENFHPDSTVAVAWNGQFIHGWARRARTPEARRADVARRMEAIGIHNQHQLRRRLKELRDECVAAERRRPAGDGQVFYPRLALPADVF